MSITSRFPLFSSHYELRNADCPLRGPLIDPRRNCRLFLADPSLERSRVFFDIEIGGVKAGRVAFELVSYSFTVSFSIFALSSLAANLSLTTVRRWYDHPPSPIELLLTDSGKFQSSPKPPITSVLFALAKRVLVNRASH